ncbi:DUF6223 family protein [Streptomyces shaanxiensis]|uniref:Uncharacterized protein n=1 Tax=Streptomyces shaanxiensis TaxID=653357 RepID=A0ABP7UZK5_9ACTN
MSVRRVLTATAAALLGGFWLAAPAVAQAAAQPSAAGVTDLSAGRVVAIVAGVLGLVGAAVGVVALARPAGRFSASGRLGTVVPPAAGLTALALGGLVVATADGGLGTGNGLGGGVVAMVLGLIGVVLGGLARSRSRRLVAPDGRRTG